MHRNCLRNSVGKYSFGKIDIKIGESMELKQDFIERMDRTSERRSVPDSQNSCYLGYGKWCESSRIFYSDTTSGNQLGTGAVTIPVYWAVEVPKQGGGNRSLTIPPPRLLSLYILRPVGLLFPLFLPQDTVNALSDFLGFFYFLFQCKIPLIKRFPLGGQLGVFFFPCLCRDCGLAVHHAFEIIFRRCE